MTPLWTRDEAVNATRGKAQGPDWLATGVSIDSRSIGKGDLFVALAGPNHDGHDHVAGALADGAAAALVHKIPEGVGSDVPLLLVEDTLEGLRRLGAASRARTRAKIVGVTGSVGKTGTKEMLKLALGEAVTHASVGSFNNHWGVPLSLARMPAESGNAVLELGMNHAGEIAPLTALVRPDIAIVTTVEAVHLEFFASTREIAEAKAEIFSGVVPGGIAILPRDNPYHGLLRERAEQAGVTRFATFGTHIEADARLLDFAVVRDQTLVFALIKDTPISYAVGVPGRPWAMNSLAVLLAADAAGIPLAEAAAALATMRPPKGRGERKALRWGDGAVTVIDESYNASPVSVRAALATLGSMEPGKGGRRVAVLGDMLELGEQGPALHRGLAEQVNQFRIDLVFTAGPLMGGLFDALRSENKGAHASDSAHLAPMVAARLTEGDVVMVKGSAGSRMGRVVSHLDELATRAAPAANGH
ncbi:MAG TPA: UDP-N-acetylmuramoylalanyl-D-glutamyl-2,6-diaminopimelate--D-alanyl-D-alanine ligase [Magnetospirillaceae bacterium]|nr:UDP-N-acetylmuramoylalanyl-D-glutamyl-2,6-diaminopimelate--D-alanyl-D-alanine ligase [Magnetospirillaceae bacterium]